MVDTPEENCGSDSRVAYPVKATIRRWSTVWFMQKM